MNNQRGFIIPPFLLSPTGIMATAIAVLCFTNFVTYKLWRSEVAEYAQFKTDVVTQSEILKAEAERAKAESGRISAEADAKWKDARSKPHRTITVRVPTDCNKASLRPVPFATGLANAGSTESAASTEVDVAQCETIANNAVVDAAQVLHIQSWIKQQHEVRK